MIIIIFWPIQGSNNEYLSVDLFCVCKAPINKMYYYYFTCTKTDPIIRAM